MEKKYRYNAFISYRHVSPDKDIACKLQKKLENYKPPKSLSNGKKKTGWRVFRDETELPTSSNLSNDIKAALEDSEFLIVICSNSTKESRWCMEEIDYFKELHNGNNSNIITLVADGNPEDVFPASLCNELIPVTDEKGVTTYQNHVIEPLAANVSARNTKESLKKLNTEFLRIAAPILGCGYDNLYNREHKKKIRRIFTLGGIVLSILLLFGIYNSAMLWQINNQKVALVAANADLQKKTEELDLSNKNLTQSNQELEKKTKEAEDNLTEANKQKKKAEDNLIEAEKQRKIAEQNLAEANRQKKIAEDNLAEANRQQAIAEANADEARNQKNIAEANAEEANAQRLIAEESENKANEANKNLRIKNSEILANQAKLYLNNDNVYAAVETALESMPQNGEDFYPSATAKYVLATATNAYNSSDKMLNNIINLSGYVEFLAFSEDGTRLLAKDSANTVYVIDYDKNKVIKTFTTLDTFGKADGFISDIIVDGNTGLVMCNDQIISINLSDGNINWHFNTDDDIYISSSRIITNPNADYMFVPNSSSYVLLDKHGNLIRSVDYKQNEKYHYDSWSDYVYMDCNGNVYIAQIESGHLYIINKTGNTQISLDSKKDDAVISMGENEECIFINIGIADENSNSISGFQNAQMICFDKKDLSVKWQTGYYVQDGLWNHGYHTMFNFNHNIKTTPTGEYENKNSIVTVENTTILTFDRQTGELYFNTSEKYEDRILYCEPDVTGYSLKIATPKEFVTKAYLGKYILENWGDTNEPNDTLIYDGGYTFDKERKYVAYSEGEKYALASENSSEISLYHKTSFNHHTEFSAYPKISGGVDVIANDGNGVFAATYYDYVDSIRTSHLIIYDAKSNRLNAFREEDLRVEKMVFSNNKLLLISSEGQAKILDYNGNVLENVDLAKEIKTNIGYSGDYFSIYIKYISVPGKKIVLCTSDGIFTIDISGEAAVVETILKSNSLDDYCITNGFASCLAENYKENIEQIVYFISGDKNVSYVSENGKTVSFVSDSIMSVVNTDIGNKIAFINKEGYIGIYSYGDTAIKKIAFQNESINPIKLKFTPNGQSLIAMCSNGKFIRYDVSTGEIIAEYKVEFEVNEYTLYEFMDDDSLYIRRYKDDTSITIIDIEQMEKIATVSNFMHYLKSERKLIYRQYDGGHYKIGYYDYKTTDQLVDFAKTFLETR